MQSRQQRRRRRRRILRRTLLALFLLFGAAGSFALAWLLQLDAWGELDMSKILDVQRSLILYDADGAEITTLHTEEDRIWVGIEEIPPLVRYAFISAEDARFYDHFGVDIIRIFGAAWADLKAGAYVQGASTISQQLIKLSHLTDEKRMERKIDEAVLAYQLEQRYEKDEILEMYLNYVYFGGGYYGIEAAARGYFGVHASELSVAQAAQLAGILKSPSNYAPHLDMEASIERRNLILSLMQEYGYLDAQACAEAKAEPVALRHGQNREKRGYYVDLVLTEACGLLDVEMDELLSGGYRIYTAMDSELQAACERMFADDACFPQSDGGAEVEGALVVVDVRTGGVAALMGGRENDTALAYNRATRIRRQPGSLIKPVIVYAPALESGYTAATMLLDEETDFDGYKPGNSGGQYRGWVTMRQAVTSSLNVPAVSVMADIGIERGKRFAQSVGIAFDERDRSLALALGGFTYGVSPYQMAAAYAAFASGGVYAEPSLIYAICDEAGNVLYSYAPERKRVMREGNAYILTSMLESAVQTGTGHRLGELDIPLAGKTGTTGDENGNRDIWMAAYNPQYAAAVWMGYDSEEQGRLPDAATGGTYPALMLREVFETLYPEGDAPDFVMPPDVREYRLDGYTLDTEHVAVLANVLTPDDAAYSEVFLVGTEPDDYTAYWRIPAPPESISLAAAGDSVMIYFSVPSRFCLYRLYREGADGAPVLLGEFSGGAGSVSYTDAALTPGDYAYYAIPVHPQLEIGGERVVGAASERVHITLPA